jgi:hypothetical protein
MRTLAGLLVAFGVVLVGCGGDDPGHANGSTRSAADVAADEDASAAEIVEAGDPFDADGSDDGTRLVLYRVVGETGDVEQTAWRVYGADGDAVADGKAGGTALGLGDGFWVGGVIVGADGRTEEPPVASQPLTPRPGDLVVRDFEEIKALRADPLTLFAPRPTPTGFSQGWALDAAGRQWYQRVEPDEVLVADGRAWQRVRAVPVRPGQHLLGFGITPVGDSVVLPVVRSAKGDRIAVAAIAVRRADALAATAWELLDAGPLASGTWELSPRTFAADERHYVFSDLQRPPYVLDVRTGLWSGLSLPTDDRGWTLEPGRDGLYAFPPSGAEDAATDAWFSTDLGATWKRLPH